MFNSSSENLEPKDPRQKCCWEGRYFFDAFKVSKGYFPVITFRNSDYHKRE